MKLMKDRLLTEGDSTDIYRMTIEDFSTTGMKECEIKPCRQIMLLRYPL